MSRDDELEKRGAVSEETSHPSGSPSAARGRISSVLMLLPAADLPDAARLLSYTAYPGVPTLSSFSSVAVNTSMSSASLNDRAA